MKTDLRKVLSISGKPGLYLYVSQATQGVIIESIVNKSRTCVGLSARMTSLADISIYTDDQEVKLQEVFENMKNILGENDAPSAKSNPNDKLITRATPFLSPLSNNALIRGISTKVTEVYKANIIFSILVAVV